MVGFARGTANSTTRFPHLLSLQGMEPDAACAAVPGGLEGFPTWVIGGKKSEGDLTLQQLEERLSALGY